MTRRSSPHVQPPDPDAMIEGSKYLIIHRIGEQRYSRRSLMVYLGKNEWDEYQFSARPVAGTQTLTRSMIFAIESKPDDAEVFINRRSSE